MAANFTFRLATQADVPAMLEIYAPYVLNSAVSFELELPAVPDFWTRVREVLAEAPWLVCETAGTIAGYAYASRHRTRKAYQCTRELSVYVAENFRRLGIGKELYLALIRLLQLQGYSNTLAGITLPNEPSVSFHEQIGFRPVGVYHRVGFKFGNYYDVGWWELPIREELPERIRPLAEIIDTVEWQEALTFRKV